MDRAVVRFFPEEWDKPRDAANVTGNIKVIRFNLKELKKMAKLENMTIGECFSMCMSHELIHQILFDEIGERAYSKFDHVCYSKYREMKEWIGGVGAGPKWTADKYRASRK